MRRQASEVPVERLREDVPSLTLLPVGLVQPTAGPHRRSLAALLLHRRWHFSHEDTVADLVLDLGDKPATTHCFRKWSLVSRPPF